MKLSEAMRLGAMALPEIHGPIFDWDGDAPCAACAMGAAIYAAGLHVSTCDVDGYYGVTRYWPEMNNVVMDPQDGLELTLLTAIVHLFETRLWSRERIADWLQTLEQQHEASVALAAVDDKCHA